MGGKMKIKEKNSKQGMITTFARWVARAGWKPPTVSVEIQWPMAQTSKSFEIQRFSRPQIELLIWMMYGAGFNHDAITILLTNMAQAKMAELAAIEEAIDGTEPVKDALNKAWSSAGSQRTQ